MALALLVMASGKLSASDLFVHGFTISPQSLQALNHNIACNMSGRRSLLEPRRSRPSDLICAVARSGTNSGQRYGPPLDDDQTPKRRTISEEAVKEQFRDLIFQVLAVQNPNHIPSLLTKNMEFLLNNVLSGSGNQDRTRRMIESILSEVDETDEQSEARVEHMEAAIDIILSFAEDFVQQTLAIDDQNKKLLGKIIKVLAPSSQSDTSQRTRLSTREREEALDDLLRQNCEEFTPGFLRHIEGECERIANAPKMTTDSTRMLEMLRMIQARVVEELGSKQLSEAAQVLGQLVAYDNKVERLGVLEAGLTVRGLEFGRELLSLSNEALDGFGRVPKGSVDPDLVERVVGIRERLERFVKEQTDAEPRLDDEFQ